MQGHLKGFNFGKRIPGIFTIFWKCAEIKQRGNKRTINTVIAKCKFIGFTNISRSSMSRRESNLAILWLPGGLGILLLLNRHTGAPREVGSYPGARRGGSSYPGTP
jgi:hypothetical protein